VVKFLACRTWQCLSVKGRRAYPRNKELFLSRPALLCLVSASLDWASRAVSNSHFRTSTGPATAGLVVSGVLAPYVAVLATGTRHVGFLARSKCWPPVFMILTVRGTRPWAGTAPRQSVRIVNLLLIVWQDNLSKRGEARQRNRPGTA